MKLIQWPSKIVFSILAMLHFSASAQVNDEVSKKIDSIFFHEGTNPGWVIGVVRNDTLIYKNAGGIANLEYNFKTNLETIFPIASNSKQFTAYCIMALDHAKKLSLDDDINKYLSWIPDFKQKITIRNLLNNSSGMRDYWQLLGIAGVYSDDIIIQDNIIKLLERQQTLNFSPGDEYQYSNTNYILLAEIVKSVSGKSLRQFADSTIFKPLNMGNTFVFDDNDEIVYNRAYSYYPNNQGSFLKFNFNSSTYGPTGVMTTVDDFSKWVINYYKPTIGGDGILSKLTTKGKLNNGGNLNYANGLMISDFMGWKSYWHNGKDAGYNSFMAVFPEKKMGFIMLNNSAALNPMMYANKLLELFLDENTSKTTVTNTFNQMSDLIKDSLRYFNWTGDYISKSGVQSAVKSKNGKLYLNIFGRECQLRQLNADTFRVQYYGSAKAVLYKDLITHEPIVKILNISSTNQELIKIKYDYKVEDPQLQSYTGNFYSSELDCYYQIILKDHELYLTNKRLPNFKLKLISKDHMLNDSGHMNHLTIVRNNTNKIIGFDVDYDKVLKLRFKKL